MLESAAGGGEGHVMLPSEYTSAPGVRDVVTHPTTGESLTVAQWAERLKIRPDTFRWRVVGYTSPERCFHVGKLRTGPPNDGPVTSWRRRVRLARWAGVVARDTEHARDCKVAISWTHWAEKILAQNASYRAVLQMAAADLGLSWRSA